MPIPIPHTWTGMVTSNEPGYYADGRFGIRIESLIICNEASTPNRFGGVRCVYFEYVDRYEHGYIEPMWCIYCESTRPIQ